MLKVTNVSYIYQSKYQKVHAVKNVNCSFDAGKFYVIEGSSGSGKTTFLSLLAGLDQPSEGMIYLEGKSYHELDMNQLRKEKLTIIFQTYNLFPQLTVLENVMYPLQLLRKTNKEAKKIAEQIILDMGLKENMMKKYPVMLSGGEQQRVAIARSLASGAKIILADEPTGNLDSKNAKLVIDILKNLAKRNAYCVICVTHDQTISAQADVLFHMRDGLLEEVYSTSKGGKLFEI